MRNNITTNDEEDGVEQYSLLKTQTILAVVAVPMPKQNTEEMK